METKDTNVWLDALAEKNVVKAENLNYKRSVNNATSPKFADSVPLVYKKEDCT